MKNLNEPTPFEQYEADQHRPFDYDAYLEDGINDRFRSIIPRENGTQAGIEALKISLARN